MASLITSGFFDVFLFVLTLEGKMTNMRERTEVLLVNTEHLNKDNLGKQASELKEKIAFVLQIKVPSTE